MNDYQIYSSLPNSNAKPIDYVIKYSLELNDEDESKDSHKENVINLFLNELSNETLEVYRLEIKTKQKKHMFVLVHCPLERLLAESEQIKLIMKLKDSVSMSFNESNNQFPLIKYLKRIFNSLKKKNQVEEIHPTKYLFTKYDRTYRTKFYGIDTDKIDSSLFPTPIRNYLVHNILNNIEIRYQQTYSNGSIKKEDTLKDNIIYVYKGIECMLNEKYFQEAFFLHDFTSHQILLHQLLEDSELIFKNDEDINKIILQKNFKSIKLDAQDDKRSELYKNWAHLKNIFKYQPINLVKEYFGEETAFYFAFVGIIITSLWLPTIIGVAFFFAGIGISYSQPLNNNSTNNYLSRFAQTFDNDLALYYAIIMCLWGAFYLEYLKRHIATLSFEWNVLNYNKNESELPEYTKRNLEIEKSLETNKNQYVEYFLKNEIKFKYLATYILLILMIFVVAIEVAIIATFRVFIKVKVFPDNVGLQLFIGDLGSTVLNAIFTTTLNWSYDIIAFVSTKWENNRTRSDFNNSLIFKTFAFQFVNNYACLIYMAFFRNIKYQTGLFGLGSEYQDTCDGSNCMSLLSLQLIISLIIKPIPSLISTVIYPIFYVSAKDRQQKKATKKVVTIRDADYETSSNRNQINQKHVYLYLFNEQKKPEAKEMIIDQYKNKVIMFGYIIMFACSFYLGPLLFLIINLIDMRINGQSLLWLFKRSIPHKAQDIRVWYYICRFINISAIVINGLIIAYASNWSKTVLKDDSTNRLIFFVSFEHIIFFIWFLITYLIPDVPKKTLLKMEREKQLIEKLLENAKIENEMMIQKKDNWILERMNKDNFKTNLKTQLANISKNPFEKAQTSLSLKTECNENIDSVGSELESGIIEYPSGDRYEGEFLNKKKHGKGIYYWKNGAKYGGDWFQDEMTGQGTYWYFNGDSYFGDLVKGLKHGQGTYTYRNGEKYIGQFEGDRKHGKGTFYFKSGDRYEGDYYNGLKHGKGTYFYSKSGEKYSGDIRDNRKTGQGTYLFANGDVYEGGFYNGKMDGKGVFYSAKLERSHTGFWSNGIEVKKLANKV